MPENGRPPKLDQVVHTRADGTKVTAAQTVLERITLGMDYIASAATAGIANQTIHNWRRAGAHARLRAVQGHRLTPKERRYAQFMDEMEQAQQRAHLERLAVIQRATMPFTSTKTSERTEVTYDRAGQPTERVVERTRTTETKPGAWTAAAWWLERRLPHLYTKRYEVSGPDGGPVAVEQRAADLADQLRSFLAGADTARALDGEQAAADA